MGSFGTCRTGNAGEGKKVRHYESTSIRLLIPYTRGATSTWDGYLYNSLTKTDFRVRFTIGNVFEEEGSSQSEAANTD